MRVPVFTAVLGLLVVAPVAEAQVGARRPRQRAFSFAITPFIGLGFRGVRANEFDEITCPTQASTCFQHGPSSGPQVGVGIQTPLFGSFGLSVTGSAARPTQKVCIRGACSQRDKVTAVRAAGLLLFRFKGRAPIYFGLGGTMLRFDPGPVFSQVETVTEFGLAFAVGYDFAMGSRFGGRIAFMNYVMSPDAGSLPPDFSASSTAWDSVVTFGARISLGS